MSVVVGMVSDVPHESIALPIDGVLVNVSPLPNQSRYVVRTDRPEATIPAITRWIKEVAPDAPLIRVTTGRQLVTDDVGRQLLGAWLLSGSGIAALILGAGGVFRPLTRFGLTSAARDHSAAAPQTFRKRPAFSFSDCRSVETARRENHLP